MGVRGVLILFVFLFIFYKAFKSPYFGALAYVFCGFVRPDRLTYEQSQDFHLYMVLGCIVILSFLLRKKLEVYLPYRRTFICVFLIAAFGTLSSFFAQIDPRISFQWSNTLVTICIVTYILRVVIVEKGSINGYILTMLAGGSFIAVWSFEQHFRGNERLEEVAGGAFNESNAIAMLMVQILPLLAYYAYCQTSISRKAKYRICYAGLALITIGVVIFTESRAGLIGCALALFIFACSLNGKYRAYSIIAMFVVVPIIFSMMKTVEGFEDRMQVENMTKQTGGREILWKTAYEAFSDFPLTGVGQQNFKYMARDYAEKLGEENIWFRLGDAHNTFLLYAAEGGVGQVTAYIFAIVFFFCDIFWLFRHTEPDPRQKMFYWTLAASMAGLVVVNIFHSYPAHENIINFLIIPECLRNIYFNERNNAYNTL